MVMRTYDNWTPQALQVAIHLQSFLYLHHQTVNSLTKEYHAMTGRERFLLALRREQPDRVPIWELIINAPTITGIYGDVGYYAFAEKIGLDAITVFDTQRLEDLGNGLVRDEWGILWQTEPCGLRYPVDGPIKTKADLDSYRAPDPFADHRLDSLKDAVRHVKGDKAIVICIHEAFEFSHYLCGMDRLLTAYIEDPEFVHRLSRIVVDYKKTVLDLAVAEGADVILSGDDYAYRTQPLMSPAHFAEYSLPYITELVEAAHSKGVPFIKHTDGYIWPILDMLVDAGIDAINPLEPVAGMDIGDVKVKYGDRIAVVGNVDCTEVLTRGTKEEIVEAVKETIAKASIGGGHILSLSNSIHPGISPDRYLTMVEAAREFGTYPLDEQMIQEFRTHNYISRYTSLGRDML